MAVRHPFPKSLWERYTLTNHAFVGGSVGRRENLYALIGFQIANENHQKLDEIAVE